MGAADPLDQFVGRTGGPSAEAVVLRIEVTAAEVPQHADERDHEDQLEGQDGRADREDPQRGVREQVRHQPNKPRARSRVFGLILHTRNFPSRSAVISSALTSSFT